MLMEPQWPAKLHFAGRSEVKGADPEPAWHAPLVPNPSAIYFRSGPVCCRGNVQRPQNCATRLTSSIHRQVVTLLSAKINLLWTGQLLIGIGQHLFPLRDPA
jgi:hypothetical protein